MKRLCIYFLLLQLSLQARPMTAEDYYAVAFDKMSEMLAGKSTLSIKRAAFLAEWAYYEGHLDYQADFCKEIDRIVRYLNGFYEINKLYSYKTGKQIALNDYFFRPFSGNQYKPYTYNIELFSTDRQSWDNQFVSKVLKSHCGQCRSLPWLYKILAVEIGADVSIAYAPLHCYIMYKDEDNFTPEEWINLELTTHQMHPAAWIKQDFAISDSAVQAGTYMTPLTDIETVASQMADLAFGYCEKFDRYDEFTYHCASRSLEFYPMNPNALVIRGKSLTYMIECYLKNNGNIIDEYYEHLVQLLYETRWQYDRTYLTEINDEFIEHMKQRSIEARKYIQENLIPK